jgi:ABC-type antimicrobial peptide transport system permease subunit
VGVTIGFIAAWILGRLIRGLLFEVTPWDWATYAAVVVVLALVAGLAGYLPARQATRIDPLKALRAD